MQHTNPGLKTIPDLETEDEIDDWLAHADLSEYDLTPIKVMTFELAEKGVATNLHLPADLLSALEARSKEKRIPVEQLIRTAIEDFLRRGSPNRSRKTGAPGKSAGAGAA